MENTTKALLIAASVLIVILLVTFALRILNSTNNDISDSADNVGEGITSQTEDASKKLSNIFKDTTSKNLVNISDFNINMNNFYYHSYFPTNPVVLLEPNTKYTLSFDYKINSADYRIGCGIGYGETYYQKDIIYSQTYPNQTKGTFEKTFTTPSSFIVSKPYLQLRFARMDRPGNFNVDISNVAFRKVK